MQKKIIALAVAGLVSGAAFAQSNVEIYGTLDIGYLNATRDGKEVTAGVVTDKYDTKQTSTGFESGAMSSNNIGFRGTEALGNGLKASFQLELGLQETATNRLGGDSGTEDNALGAFAIRKQNLGLEGGFGKVIIGRQGVLLDEATAVGSAGLKNNAVGDLYSQISGSGGSVTLRNVAGAAFSAAGFFTAATPIAFADVRANELITYVSPNFSGFTAAVQYGKGETDTDNNTFANGVDSQHTNWGLRVDYANGPLAAVFSYNKEKNEASASNLGTANLVATGTAFDRDSWVLGANYNFGVAKVFGQWFDGEQNQKEYGGVGKTANQRDVDMRGWELGLHVPVTAQITLGGAYFDTSYDAKATNANGTLNGKGSADGNGYQLFGLYSLSKRTTAYVAYGHESIDYKAKAVAYKESADGRDFAVGVKHTF